MWTKKLLIAACLVGFVHAAVTCNPLLNCKTCVDESHCDSCPDGYVLDSNSVCRYDCSKFGSNCATCTSTKCICSDSSQEWDSSQDKCVAVKECSKNDPAVCTYCGVGYQLLDFNGKCSTCEAVFGTGCKNCSDSKCLTAKQGYKLCGAVAVAETADCPTECSSLIPGCSECNNMTCANCSSSAVAVGGFCKYKLPTCTTPQKVILKNNEFTCGTCQSFDENCIGNRCTGTKCTMCRTGFGLSSEGGCVNCSSKFPGCIKCLEDACTQCKSSIWVLTPNGCFNQNPYVPPEESKAGMIAGIVIGVLALIAIVTLAVFCIVTGASKHGQVDPSLYEDDLEFKSSSML